MSVYYRHLIEQGKLLDIYPNAAVAYSLRKLRSDYKKVFNLLSYSEDISQATYQKNALITTGTPPYIDVETAPNGTMTADKLIEDTSFTSHFLTQTLGITVVGLDYNFSVYVKAAGRNKVTIQAGTVGQARINLLTGSIETTTFPITPVVSDAGNGWWRFSVTFNANSTLLNPLYRIFTVNALDNTSYIGDGVSGLYVWGFQLTQSSTVLPYEKTVASPETGNAIRVRRVFDSTELDIGFTSTGDLDTDAIVNFFGNNLTIQSEDFGTASWAKSNSVIVTDAIIGPNGIDMADKLNENTTTNTHVITQSSGALTNGKDYFFSVYLKEGERNIVDFVSGFAGSSQVTRLNLTTGTVISNGFANTPTLTDVGNGWWKFELVVTSTVTSVPTGFQIRLTNGTTTSYLGTANWGCYIWGAQVSGYIGNPIPYFRTTTIRAADVRIVTFYDQSGNGNNSTQATPSIQHLICQNGFITRNTNNKPVILLSAVQANFYPLISTIPTTSPHFSASIYNYTGGNFSSFGNRSTGGSPQIIYQSTTNLVYRFTNNNVDSLSVPYTTIGNQIITTSRVINDMQLYGNNSLIGNRNTAFSGATIPITNITSYVSGNQIVRGELFEMIFWNQNYTTLRSDITNKINEYYGIY